VTVLSMEGKRAGQLLISRVPEFMGESTT
jgi:hypothetical protein